MIQVPHGTSPRPQSMCSGDCEVSIVLPVFNEAGSLPTLVARIALVMSGQSHEIVLVDDGSRDESWAIVEQLAAQSAALRGIRLARNFGHQPALLAGLEAARGRAVIMLDSDGQHPPECLPEMIARWRAGAVVVQMVRNARHEPWLQRMCSRMFYRVFSDLSGVALLPACADFRLLDRGVLDVLLSSGRSVEFLRGQIAWMGIPTDYIRFDAAPRISGHPQYSLRRRFRLALDGLMGFSNVPMRLAAYAGLTIGAFSLAYLAYVVVTYLRAPGVVPGWSSLAGMMALVGGMQLLCLGVIGEYVARLFTAGLHRPAFVVVRRTETTPLGPAPVSLGPTLYVDAFEMRDRARAMEPRTCEPVRR